MAERDRIARYLAPLAAAEPGSFSLTDDAAVLTPPAGFSVVVTTDSVIEGIHVLPGATAQQIAEKLVRRNLSDLAAMGAKPWRYFLNLHTPAGTSNDWFADFSAALQREQMLFGMVLAGGDSTSGGSHVHATMTCLGLVEGAALLRSAARVGDDVYVSGTIGGAALGLQMLQQKLPLVDAMVQRYHCPEPRLALGAMLRGVAHAVMDISDGLLADARQLAVASNVALALEYQAIPLAMHNAPLDGGDDYELLFTAPVSAREALATIAQQLSLPLTRIGFVTEGAGVTVDGVTITSGGWEHA